MDGVFWDIFGVFCGVDLDVLAGGEGAKKCDVLKVVEKKNLASKSGRGPRRTTLSSSSYSQNDPIHFPSQFPLTDQVKIIMGPRRFKSEKP